MGAQFTKDFPEGVYEKVIDITQQQTDSFGNICMGEVARLMQVITEEHFDEFSGTTIKELNSIGLSWVISWSEITVIRLPRVGERIRMRVWTSKKKAVMHSRKYAFYTDDGELLLETASLFALMDRETRQAAVEPESMKNAITVTVPNEPKAPKMMISLPDIFAFGSLRTVSSDEIDYNGHMNNSHYVDWVEDLIDDSYRENHPPKSVWIEYTKELLENQTALLQYDMKDDILYVRGMIGSETVFKVRITY